MSDGNMDVDESPVSWKVKSSEALVDGSFSATLSSSSRVIPASRDFDFHHKLDEFRRPIDEIAEISQSVLETIGDSEQVWGKSMKLLGDVDAEDRLFNVNDEFHKRFDVSVDEFDKEEVIGRPDAYSGEDGFQKKKLVGNEIAGSSARDMTRGSMIDDVKVAERDKNLSGKANVPFHVPTIKKPQEEYSILVNNASQPFEHDWLEWSEDGQRFMHHPLEKLSVIDFVDKDVNELEPVKPLSLEETPFKFVQEVKDLKELVAKLHSVDEFAVDLEQNQYRSSQGLTCCLMKISTRTEDYIVDTFKLSVHIGPYLRKIFKDPKKKKVMHGADRDIIWLQRDFGIYVCNLFDTAQASRVLNMERNSLDFLLQHFCGVTANKEYARENTHYLLYIYDVIRLELQRMAKDGEHTDSPLLEVYKCSYDVCTQLYAKELLTENSLSLEERKDVYLHTEDVASLSLEEKSLQVESNNAGLITVAAAFAPSSSSVGEEPLIDEYISDKNYEPHTELDESYMSVPSTMQRKKKNVLNYERSTPPYNIEAESPSEAYPIEAIIKDGELDFLLDIYWLVQKEDGPATDTDVYPLFVRNRLYKLKDIKDEYEKQTVSGILSLLTHLIRFKELYLPESSISTLPKNHLIPSIIYQKCVRLFIVEGYPLISSDILPMMSLDSLPMISSDSLPMISSDSLKHLIMYILVLTLHVDKYKTDPEDIAKDLRMSKSDLRTYYEELGCIFVYEESIVLATLQVPLKFPPDIPPRYCGKD